MLLRTTRILCSVTTYEVSLTGSLRCYFFSVRPFVRFSVRNLPRPGHNGECLGQLVLAGVAGSRVLFADSAGVFAGRFFSFPVGQSSEVVSRSEFNVNVTPLCTYDTKPFSLGSEKVFCNLCFGCLTLLGVVSTNATEKFPSSSDVVEVSSHRSTF